MLAFQKISRYVILTKCDKHNITFLWYWYSFFIIDNTLI